MTIFIDFTFHNQNVILGLVPSALIFWTDRCCLRKSNKNKATLLLCWSHRCNNYTVVITNWLTVTRYSFFKWQ